VRREPCLITGDYPERYRPVSRATSALARALASGLHTGHYALRGYRDRDDSDGLIGRLGGVPTKDGIVRRTAIFYAALLVAGCSDTARTSEPSQPTVTPPKSTAPVGSEIGAETTNAPTMDAVDTTAAPASIPNFVPPANPSALIGSTTSTKQILSNPGSVPGSQLSGPSMTINGEETTLASYGGACISADCQHAVELLADSATFINEGGPLSSYLVLESFVDRDSGGFVSWTVVDAISIADIPPSSQISLLTDECMFPNLSSSWEPVATLVNWTQAPTAPSRIWAANESRTELTELPIDPSWTCTQFTD
jgi:hypothetical protein